MHAHKKLDAESYEAAFLFNHFISSCHAEAGEECGTSSSSDSWQLQTMLDGMCGGWHGMSWLRTRSVDQGISDVFGWERYSARSGLSIGMIKTFARSKKAEHQTDLPKSEDWQIGALEDPGLGSVQPHGMHRPDAKRAGMLGSFSGSGFTCAYCDAKFRERRSLIKHLLGDHGTTTKMDLEPQSKPHIFIHNSNK